MANFSAPLQGVSMSDALKEAAAYAPVERVVLATYEFVHPSFSSRALLVCDYTDFEATTEAGDMVVFKAIASMRNEGFQESDQASTPTMKLHFDGLSQQLLVQMDLALSTLTPVYLIERIYVSDDPTTPALLPPAKVVLRSGTVTETRVTVEAGLGDPANQPFPRKLYTRQEHPGLST